MKPLLIDLPHHARAGQRSLSIFATGVCLMPTLTEFKDAAAELHKLVRCCHRFEEEPDAFLEKVHQMDERLRTYREASQKYLTREIDGVGQIRPVNFLRRLIVDRILDGKEVRASDLSGIKSAIDERSAD